MIEMGKKYRTRDGREARVYAVDGTGSYPVHGAVIRKAYGEHGGWDVATWTEDGIFREGGKGETDLIEVKPEVTVRRYLTYEYDDEFLVNQYKVAPGRKLLGAIDITHDGEKLIKVEIVKD